MTQANSFGRIVAMIMVMAVMAAFVPSLASAAVQWLSGDTYFQTGIDPYGMQNVYVTSTLSYYGNSDHSAPKVGERYWGSLLLAVTGQAASPSAFIAPEIALPPNTIFATDAANKVKCYFYPAGWHSPQIPADYSNNTTYCNYNLGSAGLTGLGWSLGSRTLLTGEMLEIQFPMVSSAVLRGNGTTTDKMQGYVTTSNAYPLVGLPSEWVWVASSTPSIAYPAPSSTLITDTTAKSWADVYNHYTAGTVYFDLGTTTSYGTSLSAGGLSTANDVGNAYMNWTGLTPGTLYHWRSRFVVSGTGTVYVGADQTFTTTGTKPVTTYTLSLSSTAGGSASVSPVGGTYALNTSVTLTAMPNPGYTFDYWTRDGGAPIYINTYTFFMNKDYTVVAHFSPTAAATFTLTPESSPAAGGTVTASPTGPSYTPGTSVTFTAVPSAGYSFGGWKVDGVDAGNANPLILTADADHTVTAQFGLTLSQNTVVQRGSTNVPMLQFAVDSDGTADIFLTNLVIQSAGSGNDAADISLVKVYEDLNGNGIVDAGEPLVSSGTFTRDNGQLNIAMNNYVILASQTTESHKFLVVYDFNTTLAGLFFAPFSLVFIGMLATGRRRNRILMALLSVAMLSFLSCGGGGGGGGGSDPGTRTYQVSISGGSLHNENYDPMDQPLLGWANNIVTHTVSVVK